MYFADLTVDHISTKCVFVSYDAHQITANANQAIDVGYVTIEETSTCKSANKTITCSVNYKMLRNIYG